MLRSISIALVCFCTSAFGYTTIRVDLGLSVDGGWPSALSGQDVDINVSLVNATDYQRWTFYYYGQPDSWPNPNQQSTNMDVAAQDYLEAGAFAADIETQVLTGSDGKEYAVWVSEDSIDNHTALPSEIGGTIDLSLDVTLKTKVEDQSNTDPNPQDGDTNSDGDVDFFDMNRIINNFGINNAQWSDGDFDGDGDVDFADWLSADSNYVPW